MIVITQVIAMEDDYFKVLVLVVVAFLIVSLTINAFLATDPRFVSSPPIRVNGYLTERGDPIPGYYFAPDQFPGKEQSGTGNRLNQ
jgi:hypothetical protein